MPGLLNQTGRGAAPFIPQKPCPSSDPGAKAVSRVLVADPCADTVESTTWLLRLWGHDVRGVRTGREIREVAPANQPDTILMEIALPELDGCEVARRLRQKDAGPDILLVAITGYADERHQRRSREAGFNYYLVKPVEPEILQSLLATNHQEVGGN